MKNILLAALTLPLLSALDPQLSTLFAQGTMFTYEGHLMDTGAPANGLYDIRAVLYASSSGGALISALYTNSAVTVSNGLFTITLDFGGLFNGTPYWLQIGVRTNGGGASFTPLSPRQQLTPTPYAIYSETSGLAVEASGVASGTVSAPQLNTLGVPGSGQVLAYNGSSLVWTNPSTATLAWNLIGNAGTSPSNGNFVGITDSNPLELHVNGLRGWRLEPTTSDANHLNIVNVVGGRRSISRMQGCMAQRFPAAVPTIILEAWVPTA